MQYSEEQAPDGFELWPQRGNFLAAIATVWVKEVPPARIFRAQVHAIDLNGSGFAHGGFLATLADIVLGHNVTFRLPADAKIVTSSLTLDYLSNAREGDWLEGCVDRVRVGRRLCHVSGVLLHRSEVVVSARGNYSLLHPGTTQPANASGGSTPSLAHPGPEIP